MGSDSSGEGAREQSARVKRFVRGTRQSDKMLDQIDALLSPESK
jgi:hypothetical protein